MLIKLNYLFFLQNVESRIGKNLNISRLWNERSTALPFTHLFGFLRYKPDPWFVHAIEKVWHISIARTSNKGEPYF